MPNTFTTELPIASIWAPLAACEGKPGMLGASSANNLPRPLTQITEANKKIRARNRVIDGGNSCQGLMKQKETSNVEAKCCKMTAFRGEGESVLASIRSILVF